MADVTPKKLNIRDATKARGGTLRLLARGDKVGMRIWYNERPEDKTSEMHSHEYETVGYVIEGRARLHFSDESILLESGDSWHVPSNMEHCYEILEELTAIEATSGGYQSDGGN